MDQNNIIESGGFYFIHNFDSGNLGHVERVPTELIAPSLNVKTNASETPDYEFNMWTRPDCAGTEFENGNRTWFYFGVQGGEGGVLVRLNLINLNKQGKMYNQGMAPVTRTLPGKPQWERIRDRPVHSTDDNTFTLSFKYRTSENLKATTFFAFTYPFSFAELQIALNSIDLKMLPLPTTQSPDDIYYYRECLIYSLEGRRVDLLTITSHHGMTSEREERLKNLFPDNQDRPYKFPSKKVIFISARVHPGETPSSFVFNGFLNLLLTRTDPIAIQLRKLYVFKMIPFLNPDGVARGHYRTDTRGVNLNRVYLNPSLAHHPSVYASRSLIRYYHFGCEKEDIYEELNSVTSRSMQNISESVELIETKKKKGSSSITSTIKGEAYKRDKSSTKSMTSNKSSTTIKQPSVEIAPKKTLKPLSGEATMLADQVYDMKLQEQQSQNSELCHKPSSVHIADSCTLLNDSVLRACLGSTVHVSTSEELNLTGGNPLRPLRDTLKNSISLLMESSSSNTAESSLGGVDSRLSNVRMGWCAPCRAAVVRLEGSVPGLAGSAPGYNALAHNSPAYSSIEEYREHQRQQFDALAEKVNDPESSDGTEQVYFCTNCFKRYLVSEQEVEFNESETVYASVGVSCGDNGDVPSSPADCRAGSTGDSVLPPPPPCKEERSKSSPPRLRKKPPAAAPVPAAPRPSYKEPDSGLYLYIDLHGHASKKGIFMYGNHFEDVDSCVECMLLPRIMSLNNLHFHFSSCNFTERNMYLKDRRDGMSREGSGRVAVLKATGLVRSYTLECNYNTGRLVNVLPPAARDAPAPPAAPPATLPPPKYTPHIFEEVGRALGASILDLTGAHPNSRIPCSEHRNLSSVRDWLRAHTRSIRPQLTMSRLRQKASSPPRVPPYGAARGKGKGVDERKENTYVGARSEAERRRSPPAPAHDVISMNMKFSKKNEPVKSASRTRYLADNEPKPKTLSTKRRNVLAVRKPNASKTQVGGVVKAKAGRRSADEAGAGSPRGAAGAGGARGFSRALRDKLRRRAPASSSSDDMLGGNWEDVAGGTAAALQARRDREPPAPRRRPFPNPPPAHLKKIRLKTGL